MANQEEAKRKIVEIFERLTAAISRALESIGLKLVEIAQSMRKPTVSDAPEAAQTEEVAPTPTPKVGKPARTPAAIADAVVRHIEVDLTEINREVARSPKFRTDLEKIISEV